MLSDLKKGALMPPDFRKILAFSGVSVLAYFIGLGSVLPLFFLIYSGFLIANQDFKFKVVSLYSVFFYIVAMTICDKTSFGSFITGVSFGIAFEIFIVFVLGKGDSWGFGDTLLLMLTFINSNVPQAIAHLVLMVVSAAIYGVYLSKSSKFSEDSEQEIPLGLFFFIGLLLVLLWEKLTVII